MKRWFVACTHPQGEVKASYHLRNQGFSVYLPQYLKPRRHARRREIVSVPLFPRYLFVGLDLERDRWRAVRSTIGVSAMICNGDSPVPVPDRVIDEIRAREDAKGRVVINKLNPLKSGDRIRVLVGAFAEQVGIFDCATDEERVRVLLKLLGRSLTVELPIDSIAASA